MMPTTPREYLSSRGPGIGQGLDDAASDRGHQRAHRVRMPADERRRQHQRVAVEFGHDVPELQEAQPCASVDALARQRRDDGVDEAEHAVGMMLDADLCDGAAVEPLIERLFDNPAVSYIHAHNAKRGCYSGRIDRAG